MPRTAVDVAVVGMGIVGLAHAYWCARAGKRVVVIDRDARATGASIQNFGFITVTGQAAGEMWTLAKRSRDVWESIAPALSAPVEHYGLCVLAQRPQALDVLQSFCAAEMGQPCELAERSEIEKRYPGMPLGKSIAGLLSPFELRVEAPRVLPALVTYLQKEWDITFQTNTAATQISGTTIDTSAGPIDAQHIIVCPGADFSTLYRERISKRNLKKCKLHMMRLADPGFRLPFAVQSDLSLARYEGYAALPEAAALRNTIENEQPDHLKHGIHLIVVQNSDGTLVVGDSHHYGDAPQPFYESAVEALILQEFERVLGIPTPAVLERWIGVYPSGDTPYFVETPAPHIRLVMVTCGAGMSTAFGLAEKTVHELLEHTS